MKKAENIVTIAFLAVLAILYGVWALSQPVLDWASALTGAALCALFGWCCARCIALVFREWQADGDFDPAAGLGRRSLRPGVRHPVLRMCLGLLIARFLVYLIAYGMHTWLNGYQGGLLDTMTLWYRGDAPHYLGIARDWYVTEGDARFHIVFFPLYPIVVRLLAGLLQNYFASAFVVSNAATVAAGYLLYELALLDMDRRSARRAVKFQFLMPAAFLLCAPMTDGLFLLLSVATLLLMRKRRYLSACAMGALAAFCRIQGILLMAPILVEMVTDTIREKRMGIAKIWPQIRRYACILAVPAGLLLYVWINYEVTGNPLQFLVYQSEHWSQRMGLFFNTAAYQTTNLFKALGGGERSLAWGLWIPNLLALFGGLLLLLPAMRGRDPALEHTDEQGASLRPLRASYGVYFLVYYFFSMGATWLLSAPRYLLCCAPFALALTRTARRRGVNILLTMLFVVLQCAYLAMYVAGWPVY